MIISPRGDPTRLTPWRLVRKTYRLFCSFKGLNYPLERFGELNPVRLIMVRVPDMITF
jgi:hypothetical protein